MKNIRLAVAFAACASFVLSGCQSTSQVDFYRNPKSISKASLCRTLVETTDPAFAKAVAQELVKRKVDPNSCMAMVQQQNQAAATVAAIAIAGTAVAVCANANCGGGGYRQYPGNCQYDWQTDAAGHRCGARSAASRPGGW